MNQRNSMARKRSIVDRFANGNADALYVEELSDDDLGNLFVYHSDTSHRDDEGWARLTAPEHRERVKACLTRMKQVNQLAVASRSEELENARAELSAGEVSSDEFHQIQSEYNAWFQRSKRFDIRVDMAFNEFKAVEQTSSDSVENDLHELLAAIDDYIEEVIDLEDLEQVFENISSKYPSFRGLDSE